MMVVVGCSWPGGYQLEPHVIDSASDAIAPTYTLNAWVPASLAEGSPVLFLLDGDEGIAMRRALRAVSDLAADGRVPEDLLVVGIGYGEEPNGRTRDYTPSAGGNPDAGEAEAFFSFVADVAVPYIEDEYGTGDIRGLGGHSLGGLAATWALFHHSDLFDHFIAMSPALMWDEQAVFGAERFYAEANADLPARLHLCVGGEENRGQTVVWQAMRDTLTSRAYPSLDLGADLITGRSHIGSREACLALGLEHAWR